MFTALLLPWLLVLMGHIARTPRSRSKCPSFHDHIVLITVVWVSMVTSGNTVEGLLAFLKSQVSSAKTCNMKSRKRFEYCLGSTAEIEVGSY